MTLWTKSRLDTERAETAKALDAANEGLAQAEAARAKIAAGHEATRQRYAAAAADLQKCEAAAKAAIEGLHDAVGGGFKNATPHEKRARETREALAAASERLTICIEVLNRSQPGVEDSQRVVDDKRRALAIAKFRQARINAFIAGAEYHEASAAIRRPYETAVGEMDAARRELADLLPNFRDAERYPDPTRFAWQPLDPDPVDQPKRRVVFVANFNDYRGSGHFYAVGTRAEFPIDVIAQLGSVVMDEAEYDRQESARAAEQAAAAAAVPTTDPWFMEQKGFLQADRAQARAYWHATNSTNDSSPEGTDKR